MPLHRRTLYITLNLVLLLTLVNSAKAHLFEHAQPYFMTIDAGTEQLYARDIAQSSDGIIWVATSWGLFSYDGYDFKAADYIDEQGRRIGSSYFTSLLAGEGQYVWAGSAEHGLYRLDTQSKKFTNYRFQSNGSKSNTTDKIFSMAYDNKQGIWLAMATGLHYFDMNNNTFHSPTNQSTADKIVSNVSYNPDGYLIANFGTHISKIAIDPNQENLLSPHRIILAEAAKISLMRVENKRIWFFDNETGVYTIDQSGKTKLFYKDNKISSINIINDEIWLSSTTGKGTLIVLDKESGKVLNSYDSDPFWPGGFSNTGIHKIITDQSGSIWIAGRIIQMVTPSRHYTRYLRDDKVKSYYQDKNYINSVLHTHTGEVYIATKKGGIDVYGGRKGYLYNISKQGFKDRGLPSNEISTMHKSKNTGDIYLATLDGELYRYLKPDGKNSDLSKPIETWERQKCTTNSPSLPVIGDIFELSDDSLLATTYVSMHRINTQGKNSCSLKEIAPEKGITSHWAISLNDRKSLLFRNGKYFVLESGSYEVSEVNIFTTNDDSEDGVSLVSGYQLPTGEIYLSSYTNIYKYLKIESGAVHIEKVYQHNYEAWLYSRDESGNIWGYAAYRLAGEDKIRPFMKGDGQIPEYGDPGIFRPFPDGTLLHPTYYSIQLVNPRAFELWRYEPPLVINKILIDGSRSWRSQDPLFIKGDEQDFTIHFAALDYSGPESIRYKYHLDGYSKNWLEVDANARYASFANLSPGRYQFRLRSTNRLGDWSSNELLLIIEVLPAWHQTWIFKSLVVIAILLLLHALFRWRVRYYRLRQIELKNLVNERTNELEESLLELKETQSQLVLSQKQAALGRLVSGVAHEINTPLGIVKMALTMARDIASELFTNVLGAHSDDARLQKDFQKFKSSNALAESNLLRLTELVASFKKLSMSEQNWPISEFNVHQTLTTTNPEVLRNLESQGVELSIEIDTSLNVTSCAPLLKQICDELLDNISKHSFKEQNRTNRKASIKCYQHKEEHKSNQLIIEVFDNGCGISKDILPNIFDPFTSASPANLGLGLHIVVNQLNTVLGGEIRCETSDEEGTHFIVTIPINN